MNLTETADNLGLDEDETKELLELYIDTTKKDLANLIQAIDSDDLTTAYEKAHSIKGASGNLTLTELYEITKDIDADIRNNSIEGIASRIETFTLKFNELIKALE